MRQARLLVVVQQRRAEKDERRENEVGEEERDSRRLVPLRAQELDERRGADAVHERERRQTAERVYEVRASKLEPAPQRTAHAAALEQRRRHCEPEERKPGESGEQKDPREQGERREDEESHPVGAEGRAALRTRVGGERACADERRRDEGADGPQGEDPDDDAVPERDLVGHGERDPER